MGSEVHGKAWFAVTLRAWHLAMLRFAVTLDNADRLAVLRIAREIDELDPHQDGSNGFRFFRRTSVELCAAILQPNEASSAILLQYQVRLDDDRLRRAFAAAIDAAKPKVAPVNRATRRSNDLWKGLSFRSNH